MKKSRTVPQAIEYYVAHRRQMGFAFEQEGWVLSTLAEYARHTHHRGPLTAELVLDWAQSPAGAASQWWARRLAIARRFAQFWVAFDPRTQIPPAGVFGSYHHRPVVHLYTEPEIAQLLAATAILGPADSLRVATFHTLFGLLACTGLRISEALRLQPHDLDPQGGTLFLQPSKFSPARRIPLHPSTVQALQAYDQRYPARAGSPGRPAFFLSGHGRPLTRDYAEKIFRRLRRHLGWTHGPRPRLHDLRHTFAVGWLVRWNQQPGVVAQQILALCAYLGHRHVTDTYWYLTALPQLLARSGERFEHLAHPPSSSEAAHA